VNPPLFVSKKQRVKGPFEYAIHYGFYRMVRVLLEAGANVIEPSTNDPQGFCAIYYAVMDCKNSNTPFIESGNYLLISWRVECL